VAGGMAVFEKILKLAQKHKLTFEPILPVGSHNCCATMAVTTALSIY